MGSNFLINKQNSFRGQKTVITQNAMCTCDFEIIFTFFYASWKGNMNDVPTFLDALTRPKVHFS